MSCQFNSFFADDIESYLDFRQSIGNERDTFARRLHSFDVFCIAQYPDARLLTKEIVEAWCTLRDDEKQSTLLHRITVLKGFAKYLNSIAKSAYIIPDGYSCRRQAFVPYLYETAELKRFFSGADLLPPHKLSPYREYIAPVLFRILYCCGLRPQEVRWLKRIHVDLDDGTLFIEQSKQNKDRVVAMSADLNALCQKYDIIMQKKLPGREYFFQNSNGCPYSASWIQQQFFRCWRTAGISFGPGKRPRVYDFRHAYALKVLTNWMHEGQNISLLLPYLSTYMGHSSLEQTAYYIHLVPEHLQFFNQTNWNCNLEVPDYED
jgi:integrase/recombinase XerD